MKNFYSKNGLIELLRRSHKALEAATEKGGCDFETAVVLVDCNNFLEGFDGLEGINKAHPQSMAGAPVVH